MSKRLLTIQDVSCVGQCSATVALPIISACGVECAVLPSAVLSNHTGGFASWTFHDLTGEMTRIEDEWRRQSIKFDAFYTGYVCPSQVDPILSILETCAAPGAVRFIDPVLGDHGKLYAGFGDDFPARMAMLCRGADYMLPNLTEAALLLGEKPVLEGYDSVFVENTIAGLHALGAKNVVLTGVSFCPDELGVAVSDGTKIEYDFNKRLARTRNDLNGGASTMLFNGDVFHGTGDVFASVFSGAVMRGLSPINAAALAADFVCAAISATPPEHWYGVAFEAAMPILLKGLSSASTNDTRPF